MIRKTPGRLRALDLAFRVASAKRLLPSFVKKRLLGLGLERAELDVILQGIRSLEGWGQGWGARSAQALSDAERLARGDQLAAARSHLRLAFGATMLSIGLTDPLSPVRRSRQETIRRIHGELARTFESDKLESFTLSWEGRPVHGFLHAPPGPGPHPLLLLLPPLGHVKEELGIAFEPLRRAGYALAGLDLPGFGESPGPMPLDAERIAAQALDELTARPDIDADRLAVLGVSLGAYWAFKLSARDPRPRLIAGISTPVMNDRQWKRLPPHLWRAFQGAFATDDPREAADLAMKLTLEGVFQRLQCPALLFHGGRDSIPIAEVVSWLEARASVPVESTVYPHGRHGLIDHLEPDIIPRLEVRLSQELMSGKPLPGAQEPAGATFSTHAV